MVSAPGAGNEPRAPHTLAFIPLEPYRCGHPVTRMHPALAEVVLHHHHRFHGPHLDYLGVAIGTFISWCGISGPGDAALIPAGILAAKGRIDLASVLAVPWGAARIGGPVGWWAGRRG